jgi:myo-inositol-1(or 4)-monophosphatase
MPASALITIMTAAARKAGKGLARDFGEVEQLQVSLKGPGNFVSAADHKAEKVIQEELSRGREGYGFLMEESGTIEGADKTHRWIVDPLDGTTNFLHGIPHFCISIGLERDGEIVAGVVFNPITNDLYQVEKGKGAFLNDKRLRVAGRRNLTDCVIATGMPISNANRHEQHIREQRELINKTVTVRRFGAAALDLCWVAAGRFDGFWERGLHPWDMAAGLLMIREAGGFVSDIDGGKRIFETGTLVVGNETIHKQLLAALKVVAPTD